MSAMVVLPACIAAGVIITLLIGVYIGCHIGYAAGLTDASRSSVSGEAK